MKSPITPTVKPESSTHRANAIGSSRLDVLDGWRGLSILAVLASHMLPLGSKSLQLNDMAGPLGMALFFTLSGFLITRFLLHRSHVGDFLVRRFARILPLAWLALLITLPLVQAPAADYLPNFLFYANLPPQHLTEAASHFWSLGVEMQFYLGVALLVAVAGQRGLLALPALCLAVTLHRILAGAPVDIVTWRRVDEILAGATLALACGGALGPRPTQWLGRLNAWWVLPVFLASCHPAGGSLNYLRPYLAALLVGATLINPSTLQTRLLTRRSLVYLASISFALYVIHHLLMFTWLGEGDTKLLKYLKRVPLFAVTFALAHVSTFYFEHPCMAWGKRLSERLGWTPRARAITAAS
jgi:peptidoglycan/LPS O-acetylase OafA/YrhL